MKVQLHFKLFKIDLVTLMLFLSVIFVPKNSFAQVTLETATTSTSFAAWNGEVVHSFTATFDTPEHRRAYFNAGGKIQLSATIEGDTTQKGADWNSILTNMGTIKFSANTTTKTGSAGLLQPVGNYDLTTSYQKIFERRGQADY